MKMVHLRLKLIRGAHLPWNSCAGFFAPACQPCPSFGNSCATAAEALWLMAQHSKFTLAPISDYLRSRAVICSGLTAAT